MLAAGGAGTKLAKALRSPGEETDSEEDRVRACCACRPCCACVVHALHVSHALCAPDNQRCMKAGSLAPLWTSRAIVPKGSNGPTLTRADTASGALYYSKRRSLLVSGLSCMHAAPAAGSRRLQLHTLPMSARPATRHNTTWPPSAPPFAAPAADGRRLQPHAAARGGGGGDPAPGAGADRRPEELHAGGRGVLRCRLDSAWIPPGFP